MLRVTSDLSPSPEASAAGERKQDYEYWLQRTGMIYRGCVVRVSKHIIAKPNVNNYNVVDIMDVNRRIGVLPREIWNL